MEKLIIEARINEVTGREHNPNVPWSNDEIIKSAEECWKAGASIVHFHTRKPDGGTDNEYENYLNIISEIRGRTDVLIHPTLGGIVQGSDPRQRISTVVRLAKEGYAPDFIPLDMLSTNLDFIDPKTDQFRTRDFVYANSISTIEYFAETLYEVGTIPYLQIWNISALRFMERLMKEGTLQDPTFLSLSHSENEMIWAHPATLQGLEAFLPFVPKRPEVRWSAHMYGANMLPVTGAIVNGGGHIAIGLGDYPYREIGTPSNADVIRRVTEIARDCGREIATPDEARKMLAVPTINRTPR